MRASPLLLTFLVLLGLAAIAVPVTHLTSGGPAYSEVRAQAEEEENHDYEEVDLVVWVSHIPATVTLTAPDGEKTALRIGEDGLQEAYADLELPLDDEKASLVVTVEHESEESVESVLTITANRDAYESREAFLKFIGFGEEELSFNWEEQD